MKAEHEPTRQRLSVLELAKALRAASLRPAGGAGSPGPVLRIQKRFQRRTGLRGFWAYPRAQETPHDHPREGPRISLPFSLTPHGAATA
jgi:hypothetical protein